ncbi:MAG: phosphodiesterase [Pirellulales bacterium]
MSYTILQFTDLHLFTDRTQRLKGVSTWDSFAAVLEDARRFCPQPDLIVVTGDVAHDEAASTYVALRELWGDWLPRCRFLPGNHDLRAGFRRGFAELFPRAHGAGVTDDMAPLAFAISLGEWRLIGLDTHIPGQVKGRLGEGQKEWLRGQLRDFAGRPMLIFQHHPPARIGTPWVDDLGHENAAELAEIVSGSSVRAVIAGHVHQDCDVEWSGLRVLTTPSTAVQFRPGTLQLEVDEKPPGYRVIRLSNQEWTTQVRRL